MIPVIDEVRPRLLLTLRTDKVRTHKGEISFPGGVRHDEDPDLLATALRETEEELGIPRGAFEVVGRLPPTETVVSGYVILPFVGILSASPPMAPSELEIAEVLEMEVSALARAEQPVAAIDGDGISRTWFAYDIDGRVVWGATGRILHGFLEVLRDRGWATIR
jgi:8-oxo-dGTP pyrophosphatase MutT (NUDIX family)